MPFTLFREIIDQALSLGLRQIRITGGEPFLNSRIYRFIAYARSRRIAVSIETNGTLIDEQAAVLLKKMGIAYVSVSLDGHTSRLHDSLRGADGAFDRTTKAMRLLGNAGIKIETIICVHKKNIRHISAVVGMAKKCGASSVKINPLLGVWKGHALKEQGFSLSVKELLDLNQRIKTQMLPRYRMNIFLDLPAAFRTLSDIRRNPPWCAIKNSLGILPDGRVSLCGIGQTVPELAISDVRREPLKRVWQRNPFLAKIRKALPGKLSGICALCVFKKHCLGKCPAHTYYQTNDFVGPYAFCAAAYQQGLFPEKQMIDKRRVLR